MDKRTRLILATVIVFFIATSFIVWFLLGGESSVTESSVTESSVTESPVTTTSGSCRGPVYSMIYQYNSAGKCMPVRCENGYQKIANQCIFDGSDISNIVLPSYNNTIYARAGRVGLRLGKMKF
mgnify:CR=1 FL=1